MIDATLMRLGAELVRHSAAPLRGRLSLALERAADPVPFVSRVQNPPETHALQAGA